MRRPSCIALTIVLSLGAAQAYPQRRNLPRLQEDVELPADFSIDFKLAADKRSAHYNVDALLLGTQVGQIGQEVFHTLLENSAITSLSLPYGWKLSFANSEVVNAASLPDGEVFVDGGLARLIGTDRGLWAAVLYWGA